MVVKHNQSLFDIAMADTGIAENAVQIAIKNGIPLAEKLNAGLDISIPSLEKSQKIINKFALRGITPATDCGVRKPSGVFSKQFTNQYS